MNKVPGKIEIQYLLVEIFERPLKESSGILCNYGPGVRGTKTQRPVGSKQITHLLLPGLRSTCYQSRTGGSWLKSLTGGNRIGSGGGGGNL